MDETPLPAERADEDEPPGGRGAGRRQQDRGAQTRERLILAGLDIFGRVGFEAASTREIARRAEANLAAILYHFGGKEGLHKAVAEHVASEIGGRIGPVAAGVAALFAAGPPDRQTARDLLQLVLEAQMATMLGTHEAEAWARFIVREQMEPSPALGIIAEMMAPVFGIVRHLIGAMLGLDPESDEVGFRVFALNGQITIFRVAQPMVLHLTGRQALAPADRALIARIVTEHVDRIVGVAATSRRP